MFNLPAYQDLSEEQDEAINLPTRGNYLIIGPPGSGKTVIAIYRAEMYRDKKQDCSVVVFNNTLNQYLDAILTEKKLCDFTSTFHRWFPAWYQGNFEHRPPELDRWVYDWQAIFGELARKEKLECVQNMILDEGQDFPPDMYRVLRLIVQNCSIFADENQRIQKSNSTIEEIRKMMGIRAEEVKILRKNYRNTLQIAELAACFYTGLRTGIPELPDRNGEKPRLYLGTRDKQSRRIARYATNNPTRTIGVMVPYLNQLQELYTDLMHDYAGPVQMYSSKDENFKSIDFSKGGIVLVTYYSAKGLQFDTVFLPQLDAIRTDAATDDQKMMFYVQMSRAKEELYLLCNGDMPAILQNVPENLYRLERL